MSKLWLTIVPLASLAAVLLAIHCLIRNQSTMNHHRRSEGSLHGNMFPWRYHARGVLSLPFDDINEPFEAWYAGDINMSRIDYYNGMDKTIQRGDFGQHGEIYKIVPMNSDTSLTSYVYISCWYKSLSKWMHRKPQTVVPTSLDDFNMRGLEVHSGQRCYKFVRHNTQYNKSNTYILYVTVDTPHKPLRFEMIGYDDMMSSHYDHYILDYTAFEPWKLNSTIFNVPAKRVCNKKQRVESTYVMNPMAEFMHFHHAEDKELDLSYQKYKKYHGKTYSTTQEHEQRKHIYKHNIRFIHSKNRQNLKYSLKPNHLTDLTDKEVKIRTGLLHHNGHALPVKHLPFDVNTAIRQLPDNLDWRDYGVVSRVRSQGMCGSCWAFSTLGAVEAMHALKTGKLVELSQQQLLDCSWGIGNHGCRGGFQTRTMLWIKTNGIATANEYGKYLAQEGYCHCKNCTPVHIDGFMHVKKHEPLLLRIALATHGPIAASVNADLKTFRFYSHGIYDDDRCKPHTNHAVLAVGYGNDKGTSYWLVKNSWGYLWGDNGYIKIATKKDVCGMTSGSLIAVKKSKGIKEFPFKHLEKVQWKEKKHIGEIEMKPLPFR